MNNNPKKHEKISESEKYNGDKSENQPERREYCMNTDA